MSEKPLTKSEAFVLRWLSKEDASSLGECEGAALNALVERGFATITPTRRGGGYDIVRVTDKGWIWLTENPQ